MQNIAYRNMSNNLNYVEPCRARQALSNEYSTPKIVVDTAENEPSKAITSIIFFILPRFSKGGGGFVVR